MSKIQKVCGNPNCNKDGIHLCSACNEEIYCSKSCQKTHWNDHKTTCKPVVKVAQTFETLSIKQLKAILKMKVANLANREKAKILDELEKLVEKPGLITFVSEHVKQSEIDSLLKISSQDQPATKTGNMKTKKVASKESNVPTPTPAQMREQADLMRKNPDMVRRSNPAFSKMTNQQIHAYADQLEQASKDPEAMKEIEKMTQMKPKDRDKLQFIQEGLSGTKEINDAWIDQVIETLRTSPDLFKTMLKGRGAMMGGITDEQINSFIDMASQTSPYILKIVIKVIQFITKTAPIVVEYYKVLDLYTIGLARYILFAIAAVIFYYLAIFIWYIVRSIIWLFALVLTPLYRMVVGDGSSIQSASTSTVSNTATGAADSTTSAVISVPNLIKSFQEVVNGPIVAATALLGGLINMPAAAPQANQATRPPDITTPTRQTEPNAVDQEFDF